MATCPNKSHPDWKALVAKVGEKGANLAYVKNGFEIPRQDGLKQAPKKTTIRPKMGLFGNYFKFSNTMDSLNNHPEVASKMIDELKKLFPEVRVFKDKIVDENGNYLNIPSDKQGRHYRNAFLSAVAWTNDSAMETPPHEYAHEYIDMYRNHPLVKKAIEKYGEEKLVTLIGKKYAGRKMSGSFNTFLSDFWKLVRNTFGAPSMVDTLTDSFAKNEVLGDQYSRGTEAVHNYQEANSPLLEKSTPLNYDEDTRKATAPIKHATKSEVANNVTNSFINDVNVNRDSDVLSEELSTWWYQLVAEAKRVTAMDDGKSESSNVAAMDSSKVVAVNEVLTGNKENRIAIVSKIKGDDIKLTPEQQAALDHIYDIFKGVDYRKNTTNVSYISPDLKNPEVIGEEIINSKGITEVVENEEKKAKRLASKNKTVQWLEKKITPALKFVTNPRLWAKYISGSENSVISRVLYKGLNDGRETFSKFAHGFNKDKFTSKPQSYWDGSTFHNPNASISELETQTFELDKAFNGDVANKSIELTKSELLMIYLTSRQKGGMSNLKKGMMVGYWNVLININ